MEKKRKENCRIRSTGTLVLFLLLGWMGCQNTSNKYNKEWRALLTEAQEKQQYTIVNFSTDWCAPCIILKKRILQDDSVANFLKTNVRFITVNAEKGLGLRLAMKYSVNKYLLTMQRILAGNWEDFDLYTIVEPICF